MALRQALQNQPHPTPSPEMLVRIMTQTHSYRPASPRSSNPMWTSGVLAFIMVALAAVLFIKLLPPGIALEWSLEGESPTAFRVYRAPIENPAEGQSSNFTLLREFPAESDSQSYHYLDTRLFLGADYLYKVEAINQLGQATESQTIIGQGLYALPGQLAMIVTGIITLIIFWSLWVRPLSRVSRVHWRNTRTI